MKLTSKLIILLSFMLLFGINVKADTNDSRLEKHRYDNVYGIYDGTDRVHIFYAQRYTLNGETAYCIEPAVAIDTEIYSSTTNWNITGLNTEVKNYIKLVAYYGYDYKGHNTRNYYLAAQELIWNKIAGRKTYWTTEADINAQVIDLSKEKEEIERLISKHLLLPSFNESTIEINIEETKNITDINRVLSDYEIYSTKGVNAKINGNNLEITASTSKSEGEIKLVRKNYTTKETIIYYSGNNQKLIGIGTLEPVTATLKIKITSGTIKLQKLDKETGLIPQGDATLQGAKYGIYNSNNELVYTYIIGQTEKTKDLPYGTYTIKEIKSSIGYELDPNSYTVTIDKNNQDIYLEVYENIIKRKVNIFKVYGTNATTMLVGEPNIKFNIYLKKTNELYKSIITDKDGYASIDLVYGTYIIKQVTTTPGYEKIEDFEIVINESNEEPINKLISNAKLQSKLKVVKIDKETKEVIKRSNIKFRIKNLDTNEYICQKVTYPEVKTICEYSTNKEGEFITPYPLLSGKYSLEEVDQVIDGYLWNNKSLEFEIGENSKFINDEELGTIFEIKFENKKVLGNLNITKYGEELKIINGTYNYEKITLANVVFGVYAKEDIISSTGNILYKKDTLITEITTDENGNAILENLELGKYYLKELKTLDDYILDSNIYEFELVYQDQYTETVEVFIEINNYLKKGTLEFNKIDISNSNPLPNTKIEIYTEDNKLIFTGYTNQNGKIILDNLKLGKYYIIEKESPEGYKLNEEKLYFEISENGQVVKVSMTNEKMKIDVPNTGISSHYLIETISSLLIISGTGVIIDENKKKRK